MIQFSVNLTKFLIVYPISLTCFDRADRGMTTVSSYKTTDFVGFEEQRDAAAFAAALQPEEPLLQFVGSAVNPFPGALDVLFFRGVLLVVRSCSPRV